MGGDSDIRSHRLACAGAIAVAVVAIAGMVIAVLVAVPVLVLFVEPAPIAFYLWMRTDGHAPRGERSNQANSTVGIRSCVGRADPILFDFDR